MLDFSFVLLRSEASERRQIYMIPVIRLNLGPWLKEGKQSDVKFLLNIFSVAPIDPLNINEGNWRLMLWFLAIIEVYVF